MDSDAPIKARGTPVARPLSQRLGEEANVKDFGAVGDGTTDDSTAVQAAIDAAGQGTVVLPPGTYRVAGLLVRTSIVLRGSGWRESVLVNKSIGDPTLTIASPSGLTYMLGGPTIQDLRITGTSTGAGLVYDTQSHATVRNVYIDGRFSRGVLLGATQHTYGLTLDHVYIAVAGDGVYGRTEPLRQINAIAILNGTEIQACGGHGVNLWANSMTIRDSIIEGNAGAGIYLNADDMMTVSSSIDTVRILDNYFELNAGGAIYGLTTFNAATGATHYVLRLSIRDNRFHQSRARDGITAAVTLAASDGFGGPPQVLSSYKGAVVGPNTFFTSTLAWVDFRGANDNSVALVAPSPFAGSGPDGFSAKFPGIGSVLVQGDRPATGTLPPDRSADYVGQDFIQAPSGNWWRSRSIGKGPVDWQRIQGYPEVSPDRGDASYSLEVGRDVPIQRWATALTDNRTVTLSAKNALNGDHFRIIRTGLGPYTLNVGGLKTIPAGTAAFVDVVFDGRAWILAGYGPL